MPARKDQFWDEIRILHKEIKNCNECPYVSCLQAGSRSFLRTYCCELVSQLSFEETGSWSPKEKPDVILDTDIHFEGLLKIPMFCPLPKEE